MNWLSRTLWLWIPSTSLAALAGVANAVTCVDYLPASNPDVVYVDHGDGTVTDTRTGLMWKQCAEGLSGVGCGMGTLMTFTWSGALSHAVSSSFAGYTNWRLPNVKELSSLVEDCRFQPAINDSLFPNTPSSSFWSGSPDAAYWNYGWVVDFYFGSVPPAGLRRSNVGHVRFVRGGQ
jgi:hypothetical protein